MGVQIHHLSASNYCNNIHSNVNFQLDKSHRVRVKLLQALRLKIRGSHTKFQINVCMFVSGWKKRKPDWKKAYKCPANVTSFRGVLHIYWDAKIYKQKNLISTNIDFTTVKLILQPKYFIK